MVSAFAGCEDVEGTGDGVPEGVDGAGGDLFRNALSFAKA